MERTICELFAGVGGFRLGFERECKDWKTVWFSQWEPGAKHQWAHDCYVAHFGKSADLDGDDSKTNCDIATVDKTKIPDHNLLVGGFPCQDYSVARPLPGAKGIEGKKGVLWWQIRDTLEAKGATFGLFENVDRLIKSPAQQRGRDFGIILSCLAGLGYSAEWRVVNAAEYGAVQRRRRVFIFAYKDKSNYGRLQALEEKVYHSPSWIIEHDGFFARTFPCRKVGLVASTDLRSSADQMELHEFGGTFKFGFENAGYMRAGKVYTVKVEPLKSREFEAVPLAKILERNADAKYYLGSDLSKWQYLKGGKKVKRTAKNGHEYEFSEGPIAFPDPIDKPARTMLTSESSLNRSTHVIEDPHTHKMRLLTPNEADRVQGFVLPDEIRRGDVEQGWTDAHLPDRPVMPEKSRYFCMGNALVVPMITRMAIHLRRIMDYED